MKIRLIGPTDIVRGWATKLREEYGIEGREGREYPSRHNPNEIRYYLDVDDRRAAEAYTGPEYQTPDSGGKHGHLATTKEDWGYWHHSHPYGSQPHEHDQDGAIRFTKSLAELCTAALPATCCGMADAHRCACPCHPQPGDMGEPFDFPVAGGQR